MAAPVTLRPAWAGVLGDNPAERLYIMSEVYPKLLE